MVNSEPALVLRLTDWNQPFAVIAITPRGDKIGELRAIANPDKVSCIYAENPLLRSHMSKAQPIDNLAPLAKAGVPMLPVLAGADETRKQIVIYSALLVIVAFVPALLELGGTLYALAAIIAGGVLLSLALTVHRERSGRAADRAAKRLFGYSIFYLFVLFAVLLLEASVGRYLNL